MAEEKSGRAIMKMAAPDYGYIVARGIWTTMVEPLDRLQRASISGDDREVRKALNDCYSAVSESSRHYLNELTSILEHYQRAQAEYASLFPKTIFVGAKENTDGSRSESQPEARR